MSLSEQIKAEIEKEKDHINELKFGELVIVVQEGKAIRLETLNKKKILG